MDCGAVVVGDGADAVAVGPLDGLVLDANDALHVATVLLCR